MNLYQISNEYAKAFDAISEIEGITEEIIIDTLRPFVADFNDKAINLTSYFKNLEAEALAIKQAEKNMSERRKVIENKVESLKKYIKNEMIRTGINKISYTYFNISLSKTKKSVEIIDEELIPEEFIRTTTKKEPDKNAILLAGGCIGAQLKESWALTIK
jgi:hypothetical protein